MKQNDKLAMWQDRLQKSLTAYSAAQEKMRAQTLQFEGQRDLRPVTTADERCKSKGLETHHVYNATAELIESEIDSSIPAPKVTPCRRQDERKARMIENMLRNEIDRLPTEEINDIAERMAKIHGGVGLLPEWDNTDSTHLTVGANSLQAINPLWIVPQDGPADLDDMDYYFVRVPTTKTRVWMQYGVDVSAEGEEAPELRDGTTAEDMVTVNVAYYRDRDTGKVGRYVFTVATELEDMPDCLSRHLKRCKNCGMTMIDSAYTFDEPTVDGTKPGEKTRRARKDECSYCHGRRWEDATEETEQVPLSDLLMRGVRPEVVAELMADQAPLATGYAGLETMTAPMELTDPQDSTEIMIEIPHYRLTDYPLVMLRNIMAERGFMGVSDVDKIADQQNTINRIEQKILDKLCKAGRKIAIPSDSHITMDPNDNEIWHVTKLTDLAVIKDFDFDGAISQDMNYLQQVYLEMQRVLGITESFLGRRDATAQSGSAKQFAAQQTAGRLESKRILKKWAWSQVYERLFKNMLANADERRPLKITTETGETDYEEWNRWEFLEIDEAGELWWNDLFLFSVDDASGLAANREAMWKETTANLQSGAFGSPQDVNTLIIYWGMMEALHYPNAGVAKRQLEEQRDRQAQMAMMQQAQAMPQQMPVDAAGQMI